MQTEIIFELVHSPEHCRNNSHKHVRQTMRQVILPTDNPEKIIEKLNVDAACWRYNLLGTVHVDADLNKSQLI